MRWLVCLLTVLLCGCHELALFDRPTDSALSPIVPLWKDYQRCLVSTDPVELNLLIDRFERVRLAEVPPPSWLAGWWPHAKSQPLRVSVDPQALGAACAIHAATVMTESHQPLDAQVLYERVITRSASQERDYFAEQAKTRLANLLDAAAPILALRSDSISSR